MRYLIKDLSKLTGVKGFTIRKWQERYRIFQPELEKNGYWYYNDDDYIILTRVVKLLGDGKKISNIAAMGRQNLLDMKSEENFEELERDIFKWIRENQLGNLGNYLDQLNSQMSLTKFIREHVETIIILVGRGWQEGLLSIADEHNFSRWMSAYLRQKISHFENSTQPNWLVVVFPGDTHELGALMHYALLRERKVSAKFVGALPLDQIVKELGKSHYKAVSVSMALSQPIQKIEKVKNTISTKTKIKRVYFGGRGYKLSKYGICREK
jgi:DNA-binding transcriptional MerR regulator